LVKRDRPGFDCSSKKIKLLLKINELAGSPFSLIYPFQHQPLLSPAFRPPSFGILPTMPIPIDRLIHSRRKTVALIIQRDGSLTVRAPLRMTQASIQEFVQSHSDWISRKQAQVKTSPPPPEKSFSAGELFLYMGKGYPLTLVPPQRPALTFSAGKFQLSRSALPKARQAFINWYKLHARSVITARVDFLAKENKFTWRKIRISSARTRWGSCSSNGTLSFTWRLIMAPQEVIDYVVVHELVHTQVRNHSPRFWRQVAAIMPAYKRYVTWLKKNGRFLTLGEDNAVPQI
jgi:predicted metal-dependent hydrolase